MFQTHIRTARLIVEEDRVRSCLVHSFVNELESGKGVVIVMKKSRSIMVRGLFSLLLMGVLAVGLCVCLSGYKETKAANIRDMRPVSVMVQEDDTLWGIAQKYYTDECGSMKDYIKEIKECNHLTSDTIYEGYSLLVPVWMSEEEAEDLSL